MNFQINNKIIDDINKILFQFLDEYYIVGGYIRDLILSIESNDIDIVVSLPFNKMLPVYSLIKNEYAADKIEFIEEFHNIKWHHLSYIIDIVPMRKESYHLYSHKPIINEGTFIDDLMRRDFTINSIYYKIKKNGKRETIDPLNGISDISNKKMLLNYTGSFTDDPSRYFRLFIYKNRFDFNVDSSIIKEFNLLDLNKLTDMNMVNELLKVLKENKADKILEDLLNFGFLRRYKIQTIPLLPSNLYKKEKLKILLKSNSGLHILFKELNIYSKLLKMIQ
ncbi:MAG: hypothetical protein JW702_10080 [Clostridiales bacterium]|nr:hypothetical protein [Clostridiales bacterium]